MNERFITEERIEEFKECLIFEERSKATIEKYIRDIRRFAVFLDDDEATKERVISYKKRINERYSVRSVNSMIAGINSMFSYFGWDDLRVKSLKLQKQIYCSEKRELTKEEYKRLCKTAKNRVKS